MAKVNWKAYEESLKRRGDIRLWISEDAQAAWKAKPSGKPGSERKVERKVFKGLFVVAGPSLFCDCPTT